MLFPPAPFIGIFEQSKEAEMSFQYDSSWICLRFRLVGLSRADTFMGPSEIIEFIIDGRFKMREGI